MNISLYRFGFYPEDQATNFYQTHYGTILPSVTNLGAMIACLGAGPLLGYGRWNCIIFTNVLVLLSSAVCMINNSVVILIGRFIYGMASGAYCVFCPKFVSEMAPPEYRGPFGSLNQFMCTLGIFVIAVLGVPIKDDVTEYSKDSFMVSNYWRVCWGIPIFISVIQIILMLTVYKYDTPQMLKSKADYDSLGSLYSKIFVKEQVQMRMNEVACEEKNDNTKAVTFSETFCDPNLRRASWVGTTLSIF